VRARPGRDATVQHRGPVGPHQGVDRRTTPPGEAVNFSDEA
jgi:hypothetical protein